MTILYIYEYEHNDCTQKGLKARPYSMDMNKEDHIVTLPKKGLKTRPCNIDMEKKDLKKLTKGQLVNQRNKPNIPSIPPRTGKWKNIKPKTIP